MQSETENSLINEINKHKNENTNLKDNNILLKENIKDMEIKNQNIIEDHEKYIKELNKT